MKSTSCAVDFIGLMLVSLVTLTAAAALVAPIPRPPVEPRHQILRPRNGLGVRAIGARLMMDEGPRMRLAEVLVVLAEEHKLMPESIHVRGGRQGCSSPIDAGPDETEKIVTDVLGFGRRPVMHLLDARPDVAQTLAVQSKESIYELLPSLGGGKEP